MGKFRAGKSGGTCRCPICGKKDADSNNNRQGYIRVGIVKDEHGKIVDRLTKKESRKLRRTREKRDWKRNN